MTYTQAFGFSTLYTSIPHQTLKLKGGSQVYFSARLELTVADTGVVVSVDKTFLHYDKISTGKKGS